MASARTVFSFLFYFFVLHQTATEPSLETTNRNTSRPVCSRKCESSEEQSTDSFIPLYQCSCSQSCSIYEDCCYDSPYKRTTIYPHKISFICIAVFGHGRYKAVASCPPDQSSDFCKDGLGHMPPVTSRSTNVTYANAFCARCNGDIENLITWNVKLRCSSDNDNGVNTSNSVTGYIYRSGRFWSLNQKDKLKSPCIYHLHFNDSKFMNDLELRLCTRTRKRSHCSASWSDLSILEMCRSYDDPVYFHNRAYRNLHCAECNYLNPEFADCLPFYVKNSIRKGLIDSSVQKFCKTRGSLACIQSLSDMEKGRQYAFADLLNIKEKVCVPPEGRRCCRGEAFDFRSRRCRKVIKN